MTTAQTTPSARTDKTAAPLTARQLAQAVALVKPHVGNDPTLPMLRQYRLDARGGDLWLSATDRFTAAAARIEPITEPGAERRQTFHRDFHALLPAGLVHQAVAVFKTNRRDPDNDPRLSIRNTLWRAVIEERRDGDDVDTTRLAAEHTGELPDVLSLLHTILESVRDATDRVPRTGFNPLLLNRFAAVPKALGLSPRSAGGAALVVRQATPTRPLLVTCSDSFVGAIMPVRLHETDDLDEWVRRLTPPASKAAKK